MGTVSPPLRGKTVGAGAERTRGGDPWVALVPVSPARMESLGTTPIALSREKCYSRILTISFMSGKP